MSIWTPPKPHYAHELQKTWQSIVEYFNHITVHQAERSE